MMLLAKRWGLLTGIAVTGASAAYGLRHLQSRLALGTNNSVALATQPSDDVRRRVTLDPTGLRYYEGENSLELTVELASDRRGSYYIVYVWTAKAWVREMPEWCRYRREEILPEIKRLTADRRIEWVEED